MSNKSETKVYNSKYKSRDDTHTEDGHSSARKPSTRKPGRTLLVKTVNDIDTAFFDTLQGLQTKYYAEKSSSYFITFSTADESLVALKALKNQFGMDVRVKFAHYRVYFTVQGLVDTSDYNTVKTNHSNYITKMAGCTVLYYRLYRKNDTYLGCGDFTIDTKEGFDVLMNQDLLKNFSFDEFTGVHYRYNKTKSNEHSGENPGVPSYA